jgi:hypothetical protein
VKYHRFEPVMTRILKQKRFRSACEETLLRAFQVTTGIHPTRSACVCWSLLWMGLPPV